MWLLLFEPELSRYTATSISAPESIAQLAKEPAVQEAIRRLTPVHYPTVWPEVFARSERSGFDCLLGNPPWEKVVVDRRMSGGNALAWCPSAAGSLPIKQTNERIDRTWRPDSGQILAAVV